jgi:hypothetical protein
LAVTRIDAPAIAAVAPTNAGGVGIAAKSTRKPTAMATPCSATPSGARFVFSMTMKAEPDTIAASSQIGCPEAVATATSGARTRAACITALVSNSSPRL